MTHGIIVIEDEPMIALDIEQAVSDAGCEVAGVAHSLKKALELLERTAFDGVILDANLGGESAKPIVDQLLADNTRFLIVSGYSHEQLELLDTSIPLVAKPFAAETLVASIQKHLLDGS